MLTLRDKCVEEIQMYCELLTLQSFLNFH